MLFALALLAAQAAPACTNPDTALPPRLSGWTKSSTQLAIGAATTLAAAEPSAAQATKRKGRVASAEFVITANGRYGIALDQSGWIDVMQGGKPLTSVAHTHRLGCTTIRKLVEFDLKPGRYRLELSGLQRPQARAMLAPAKVK